MTRLYIPGYGIDYQNIPATCWENLVQIRFSSFGQADQIRVTEEVAMSRCLTLLLFSLFISTACQPKHIEARREGLAPVKAHSSTGTFRLQDPHYE
jgi:hypothetical protein